METQVHMKRTPRYNRNETVGRPEMNKLITAAAKLGLKPEELCGMTGMDYRLIQRWENKWKTNHNFCPRRSTFNQLWKTLEDVANRNDKKALELMRTANKPEQVLLALTEEDAKKMFDVPKSEPIKENPAEQTAAQVLRSLINARLDKMTFLELALTLAAVEKK